MTDTLEQAAPAPERPRTWRQLAWAAMTTLAVAGATVRLYWPSWR
ncbi:MAG TPA: hypothetical protein VMF65_22475 [Acidimicrobiales bacterium]|nr:hypothetical protein [Acidimicrobiales bacterium]